MADAGSTVSGEQPAGRDRVVDALVAAAADLFAARGPDAVSLREVARVAGVNYGLIHQYVGTREDLLRLVFRSLSERAAVAFAGAGDERDVLDRLMSDATAHSPYVRMLAWALLQERDPAELLGRSPALSVLVDRAGDADGNDAADDDEARLRVAAVTSMVLGWRLFGGFVASGVGLHAPAGELDAAVRRLAAELLRGGRRAVR